MLGKVFHSAINQNGILGIRCNHRTATTIICYRSPHASAKSNMWLERQLIRIYTTYYFKVLCESTGQFWQEKEPCITAAYASFYGGELLDESKDKKYKAR